MLANDFTDAQTARPADEWHEDIGDVVWWVIPVTEPPWIGSPLDSDWEIDYYTHFTPMVFPMRATTENK